MPHRFSADHTHMHMAFYESKQLGDEDIGELLSELNFRDNFPYQYSEELEQSLSNTMYCDNLYVLAPACKEFYRDETSKKRMFRELQKKFNDKERKAICKIAKEWIKRSVKFKEEIQV
jgi:hypothetical protein